MRTRTKAKIAGKTAVAMAEHPTLRKAAMTVGPPVVKVRFGIVRRRARRRAAERADQLQGVARAANALVSQYGPQAVEALGLIQQPKPKRAKTFAIGFAAGGAAGFVASRQLGSSGSPTPEPPVPPAPPAPPVPPAPPAPPEAG